MTKIIMFLARQSTKQNDHNTITANQSKDDHVAVISLDTEKVWQNLYATYV